MEEDEVEEPVSWEPGALMGLIAPASDTVVDLEAGCM